MTELRKQFELMAESTGSNVEDVLKWFKEEVIPKVSPYVLKEGVTVIAEGRKLISVTEGLKGYNFEEKFVKRITPKLFNAYLKDKGYLDEEKMITNKAEKYGTILPTSPSSFGDKKVYWYADTFNDLVEILLPYAQEQEKIRQEKAIEKEKLKEAAKQEKALVRERYKAEKEV